MKSLILATALLAASVSFAQLTNQVGNKYRQFKVEIATDKMTTIYLQVDEKTTSYAYTEPRMIAEHGFLETVIQGNAIIEGQTCKFSSAYSQERYNGTQNFINTVNLCGTGLYLEFNSTEALLENKHAVAAVKKIGSNEMAGIALATFEGLKEIVKEIPQDRR